MFWIVDRTETAIPMPRSRLGYFLCQMRNSAGIVYAENVR